MDWGGTGCRGKSVFPRSSKHKDTVVANGQINTGPLYTCPNFADQTPRSPRATRREMTAGPAQGGYCGVQCPISARSANARQQRQGAPGATSNNHDQRGMNRREPPTMIKQLPASVVEQRQGYLASVLASHLNTPLNGRPRLLARRRFRVGHIKFGGLSSVPLDYVPYIARATPRVSLERTTTTQETACSASNRQQQKRRVARPLPVQLRLGGALPSKFLLAGGAGRGGYCTVVAWR